MSIPRLAHGACICVDGVFGLIGTLRSEDDIENALRTGLRDAVWGYAPDRPVPIYPVPKVKGGVEKTSAILLVNKQVLIAIRRYWRVYLQHGSASADFVYFERVLPHLTVKDE